MIVEIDRERLAYHHAAERNVRGGRALREGDEIRGHPEAHARKTFARAPKARHHLIEHEQYPVAIAEFTQTRKIPVGIDDDAVGTDDGLDEQRCDLLRVFVAE